MEVASQLGVELGCKVTILKLYLQYKHIPFDLIISLTGSRRLGSPQLLLLSPQRQIEGPGKDSLLSPTLQVQVCKQ